jgi:hypothetical protein
MSQSVKDTLWTAVLEAVHGEDSNHDWHEALVDAMCAQYEGGFPDNGLSAARLFAQYAGGLPDIGTPMPRCVDDSCQHHMHRLPPSRRCWRPLPFGGRSG